MKGAEGSSPARLARIAGGFYLMVILIGIPGVVALRGIVAAGDAGATAANILAQEPMLRLAFASLLLSVVAYVVVTGLFYLLFRPVNRMISLIAALFSLVGCSVLAIAMLFIEAPLLLLAGPHAAALGPQASRDLALLSTELFIETYDLSVIFFGFYCLLIGWLIYASKFLPRLLGVAMSAGGLLYLAFLWPPFAQALFPWHMLVGFVAECALALWLLLAGVNAERWTERARVTG